MALGAVWRAMKTGGPDVTLTGADTATPGFTAPAVDADTELVFSLEAAGKGEGGV